ncbi:hypothetical protein Tco_0807962, partial [Tanacetum coccineum]
MGYYFYYPPENKIFVAKYAKFFESGLILQEASGSTIDFERVKGNIRDLLITLANIKLRLNMKIVGIKSLLDVVRNTAAQVYVNTALM